MRTLITGGAGFIGSKLVDFLVSEGHDVTIIDNSPENKGPNRLMNPNVRNEPLDIRDIDKIEHLFQNIDCVFHMAALISVQESINNPIETSQVNILGTSNILECCRRSSVSRVVFSSTSAIYESSNTSISETNPKNCLSPYATSKICGEELMRLYHNLYGLEVIILRYFNVFGPGQKSDGPYAPVMATFMERSRKSQPLIITGNGLQSRDFVHVSDVVKANYIAATCHKSHCNGNVYNVGSGQSFKIIDIAQSISKNIVYIPIREGEVLQSTADVTKIKEELGWVPEMDLLMWLQNI